MSNFFDKKEEVINIELTQFGKHLLSVGKFQPHYYAFYDDDILYDTEYAGYSENQNEVQVRILQDTPSMKPQYSRFGLETHITENLSNLRESERLSHVITPQLEREHISQMAEKIYASSLPMGTTEYNNSFAPAWDIRILEGELSNTSTHLTGTYENLKVPQINIKSPEYRINIVDSGTSPEAEQCEPYNPSSTEEVVGTDTNIVNDLNITSQMFPDGTFMTIQQNNIVLQIDEINSLYSNDNYDIEVFLIEDIDTVSGEEERLVPLQFIKKPEKIVNGILVDLTEQDMPEPTEDNVEYYLDITVDREQADEFWESRGATPRKSDIFYNEEDFEKSKSKKDISIQGLYSSNNTGPFGEEC
jgi:hypothetical protein